MNKKPSIPPKDRYVSNKRLEQALIALDAARSGLAVAVRRLTASNDALERKAK